MEELRAYLNALSVTEQEAFAIRCGTTVGYLRKVMSTRKGVGEELAINIERETGAKVRCEQTCPGTDWAYIRGTAAAAKRRSAVAKAG